MIVPTRESASTLSLELLNAEESNAFVVPLLGFVVQLQQLRSHFEQHVDAFLAEGLVVVLIGGSGGGLLSRSGVHRWDLNRDGREREFGSRGGRAFVVLLRSKGKRK